MLIEKREDIPVMIHIPCCFILGSSFSSTTILPLFTARCRSVVYGGPGSAPSNRYGWLQHFLSCMRTFSRRILSILPAEFRMSMSFIRIFVYLTCNKGPYYITYVKDGGGGERCLGANFKHVKVNCLPLSLHLAQAHVHLDLFLWE